MLKNHLQLVFLGKKLRAGKKQRNSARLELVKRWHKDLSDKTHLNVLKAKNVRWVGGQPSIERNDKASIRGNNTADIKKDDKLATRGYNKTYIKRDN